MKKHIHIFGASGSGTTTIAKIVSEQLGYAHFDSDDYFWLPTANPFTVERERGECLQLLNNELGRHDRWILSGSLVNWGNVLIPHFDLVVFVYVPADVRLERLKKREYQRYGNETLAGGNRYEATNTFLQWTAAYDSGTQGGRSLQKHEAWLKSIKCSTIRVVNRSLEDSVNAVLKAARSK